jgi:phosphoglycerate dehydrogenase-like enzyme
MPPETAPEGHPVIVAVPKDFDGHFVSQIEAQDPRVRVARVSDRTSWLQEAPDAEVILAFRPLREGALRSRRLRWVHALGAGVENLSQDVLGTDIIITNNHVHGDAIADHVFALLLVHTRRMQAAFGLQRARRWVHDELLGTVLSGTTMGILGLGTIGLAVARRARAFGMRVVATKRRPAPVEGVEQVFPPEQTDAVLRQAAVLVISLPLTPQTRGIVGAREIDLLPRGAFLVNIGRGGLVAEDALVAALEQGHLAGAGLDVFVQEPLPADSALWTAPGMIITPHISGDFPGYTGRVTAIFCENLRRYLAGQPLLNVVDPALGY